tara:strand:+ start:129 stop:485 length:357 start_codon:yes stop_codon:yes gene_type:complete
MQKKNNWVPEIMYEESDDSSINSNIPFVMVPKEEVMPNILYIFESRDTGELEPGLDGNPVPVFEWDLHQYADLLILKNNLNKVDYDKVRLALGLEPIDVAAEKGKQISKKIKNNLETN